MNEGVYVIAYSKDGCYQPSLLVLTSSDCNGKPTADEVAGEISAATGSRCRSGSRTLN